MDVRSMIADRFRRKFSETAAVAFRRVYPDIYAKEGDRAVFNPEFIAGHLEKPKDPRMGRFAFPVFRHAGLLHDAPPRIASKVAEQINCILSDADGSPLVTCEAVRGFLNARVDAVTLCWETLNTVISQGDSYASSDGGAGRTFLVEYSSPNIAKPFAVSHLRTTVIGNSLRLIHKKRGFDVVGINYLGDWGTQFGKMIVAYRKWGDGVDLDDGAVGKLVALYIRFHAEAERDPGLDEEARQAFKALEDGEEVATELWERFKAISLAEFKRVYERLGVQFDLIMGESFFNDKMKAVIERIEKAGLAMVSEGALVVDLDDPTLPPCLLRKADGATLYATRDLAGLIWRWENYRFHESLYVVATSQADHFKQVFRVIEMLEEAEQCPLRDRMTGRVKHVDFGWVKFGEKAMATRLGNVIWLDDVLDRAVQLARQKITEKNPSLEDIDETAELIGTGAVIFSQLSARRLKDINFIWEEVLSFEGETGPYLQYTHARLCSLLRNFGARVQVPESVTLLDREEELRVVELLADFPEAVTDAARSYDPCFLASFLLRLGGAFNKFYQRKGADGRIDKIISDDPELTAARIALVKAVQIVLNEGLRLLGIKAPDKM